MLQFWKRSGTKEKVRSGSNSSQELVNGQELSSVNCSDLLQSFEDDVFTNICEKTVNGQNSRLSLNLQQVLSDKAALAYFIQYLEINGGLRYVRCWIDIENFRTAALINESSQNQSSTAQTQLEELNILDIRNFSPIPSSRIDHDHDSLSVSTDCDSITADTNSLCDYSSITISDKNEIKIDKSDCDNNFLSDISDKFNKLSIKNNRSVISEKSATHETKFVLPERTVLPEKSHSIDISQESREISGVYENSRSHKNTGLHDNSRPHESELSKQTQLHGEFPLDNKLEIHENLGLRKNSASYENPLLHSPNLSQKFNGKSQTQSELDENLRSRENSVLVENLGSHNDRVIPKSNQNEDKCPRPYEGPQTLDSGLSKASGVLHDKFSLPHNNLEISETPSSHSEKLDLHHENLTSNSKKTSSYPESTSHPEKLTSHSEKLTSHLEKPTSHFVKSQESFSPSKSPQGTKSCPHEKANTNHDKISSHHRKLSFDLSKSNDQKSQSENHNSDLKTSPNTKTSFTPKPILHDTKLEQDKKLADKIFQDLLEDALRLFKKYVAHEAQHSVECSEELRNSVIEGICSEQCYLDPHCFDRVQKFVFEKMESYFNKFFQSHYHCKFQIDVLTSGNVTLQDILYNESILFYFMEFLEQENSRNLLEFWLAAVSFRKQLCELDLDQDEAQKDAVVLYDKYFSLQAISPLGFGDKIRFLIEENICREGGPLPNCFDHPIKIIEHILDKYYLKNFLSSQLYFKYLSELISTVQTNGICDPIRKNTQSDCSSEISISVQNTLLAMGETHRKYKKTDMNIDTTQLYDPDSLWKRRKNRRLSFGRINEMGRFVTDLEPITDRKTESKFAKAMKKFINLEENKTKEEMAWQVAEMIVKDITSVTLGSVENQS